MAKLNDLDYVDMLQAIKASLGRNPGDATRVEMTRYGDCVRNDFWFEDDACYSMLHDTLDEAKEHARSHGFIQNGGV